MAIRPDGNPESAPAWRPPWMRGARLLFMIPGAELDGMSDAELRAFIEDALADARIAQEGDATRGAASALPKWLDSGVGPVATRKRGNAKENDAL